MEIDFDKGWATVTAGVGAMTTMDTLQFIALLAGIGAISMAIIQSLKEFLPLRRYYNRYWLSRWLKLQGAPVSMPEGTALSPVLQSLVTLTVGRDPNVLYEMEADALIQRIQDVRAVILNYPPSYSEMYAVLCVGANPDDITSYLQNYTKTGNDYPKEARERLSTQMSANITALGLKLNHDWRYCMQAASMIMTILILGSYVAFKSSTWPDAIGAIFISIPFAVIGGYFAPVARDLVAALQNLRK
jgi:hypothetical protein